MVYQLPRVTRKDAGFSLMEILLAIMAFSLLLGGIFSLVSGTSQLMSDLSASREKIAMRERFVETLRQAFEGLSTSSSLEFDYVERGGNYDTYLSFVEAPAAFNFGWNSRDRIERVIIGAEIQPSGFIECSVFYLTAEEFIRAKQNEFAKMDDFPHLDLVPRMRQLSWKFYDSDAQIWEQTRGDNIRSSLTELVFRIDGDPEASRSVFWHPEM